MVLGVRAWLDEAQPGAFELVHTVNVTRIGAMLGGLHIFPRSGQIVTLQRGSQRSQFRVIWTKQLGPDEIRAGIESVAGEVDLWGLELPDRIAATPDQHTQPGIPPDPRRARLQLVQPRLSDPRWGSLRAVVRWAVPAALSVVIASLALIGQRSAVRAPGPAAPRWMQAQLAPPLIRYSPAPSTGDHMLILTSQHSAGSRLQVEEAPLGRLTFPSPPAPNAFGVVHLTVIIGTNGRVKNVRLSGGSLTLARAAVQAIRTWKYRPHELAGDAVEAESQVTVRFMGDDAVLIRFAPSPNLPPSKTADKNPPDKISS